MSGGPNRGLLDWIGAGHPDESSPAMNLHINGEERTFPDLASPDEFTLTALVESLNMKPDRVAVELNREIVPRDRWPGTHLQDGDRLEIVHFVGGGSRQGAYSPKSPALF